MKVKLFDNIYLWITDAFVVLIIIGIFFALVNNIHIETKLEKEYREMLNKKGNWF